MVIINIAIMINRKDNSERLPTPSLSIQNKKINDNYKVVVPFSFPLFACLTIWSSQKIPPKRDSNHHPCHLIIFIYIKKETSYLHRICNLLLPKSTSFLSLLPHHYSLASDTIHSVRERTKIKATNINHPKIESIISENTQFCLTSTAPIPSPHLEHCLTDPRRPSPMSSPCSVSQTS